MTNSVALPYPITSFFIIVENQLLELRPPLPSAVHRVFSLVLYHLIIRPTFSPVSFIIYPVQQPLDPNLERDIRGSRSLGYHCRPGGLFR